MKKFEGLFDIIDKVTKCSLFTDPTPSDQSSTIEEDVLEAPDTASDRSDLNTTYE